MKTMRKIVFMIMLCLSQLFIQCSSDDNKTFEEKTFTEQEINEITILTNFLSTDIGIDVNHIAYDLDLGGFIIDGDVLMPLEEARDRYAYSNSKITTKTNQRRSEYKMTPEISESIKLFITPEVPSDWKIAINQAINNWNTINSSIHITIVDALSLSNIKIDAWNGGSAKAIAYASMPYYSGNPGNSLSINTYYNYLKASTKVNVMIHELGHTFGLNHTNTTDGTLIPCTPISDMNSEMHSIAEEWINGFTYYDNVAISTLYPVAVGTKKLYRYKKDNFYFYSTNACEITPGKDGYVLDGDCGYIYTSQIPGTIPLYRHVNDTSDKGHGLYTSNASSKGVIIGYLYNYQAPGTTALYDFSYHYPTLSGVIDFSGSGIRYTTGFVIHKSLRNKGIYNDGFIF